MVYTGVCLVTPDRKIRQKIVETKVRFKRLSGFEIENYLASGQWRGKAGAYGIQGLATPSCRRWWAPIPMSSACRFMKPFCF